MPAIAAAISDRREDLEVPEFFRWPVAYSMHERATLSLALGDEPE